MSEWVSIDGGIISHDFEFAGSTLGLRLYAPLHDVPPRIQQAWEVRTAVTRRIERRDVPVVIETGDHANA